MRFLLVLVVAVVLLAALIGAAVKTSVDRVSVAFCEKLALHSPMKSCKEEER